MYYFLDLFFIVFHTCFIIFNLTGWIWRKTQKLNLVTLSLTAFSWMILGIWFGFGYCPCTDWHWMVRRKMGYHNMPDSYITFLVEILTGWQISATLADWSTGLFFILAFSLSVYMNFFKRRG